MAEDRSARSRRTSRRALPWPWSRSRTRLRQGKGNAGKGPHVCPGRIAWTGAYIKAILHRRQFEFDEALRALDQASKLLTRWNRKGTR